MTSFYRIDLAHCMKNLKKTLNEIQFNNESLEAELIKDFNNIKRYLFEIELTLCQPSKISNSEIKKLIDTFELVSKYIEKFVMFSLTFDDEKFKQASIYLSEIKNILTNYYEHNLTDTKKQGR